MVKHPRASYHHIFLWVPRFPPARASLATRQQCFLSVSRVPLLKSLGEMAQHPSGSYQQVSLTISRFPRLKPLGSGANHPRTSYLPASHPLSSCSSHPAENHWVRRSHVASPTTTDPVAAMLVATLPVSSWAAGGLTGRHLASATQKRSCTKNTKKPPLLISM